MQIDGIHLPQHKSELLRRVDWYCRLYHFRNRCSLDLRDFCDPLIFESVEHVAHGAIVVASVTHRRGHQLLQL
jgi:hypothetical protein